MFQKSHLYGIFIFYCHSYTTPLQNPNQNAWDHVPVNCDFSYWLHQHIYHLKKKENLQLLYFLQFIKRFSSIWNGFCAFSTIFPLNFKIAVNTLQHKLKQLVTHSLLHPDWSITICLKNSNMNINTSSTMLHSVNSLFQHCSKSEKWKKLLPDCDNHVVWQLIFPYWLRNVFRVTCISVADLC